MKKLFTLPVFLFSFTISFSQIPSAGNVLWLKADAGVTVNGSNEVTQWADQSGNNTHAVSSGTTLPTLLNNAINNKPVIRFTDDRLETPLVDLTATQKTESFVVYKGIGANGFLPFEFGDDVNVMTTAFYQSDQDNTCPGCSNDVAAGLRGDVGYNQNTLNQTQGCPKIINAIFDKSLSTEEVKIWLNDVLQPKKPGTLNADNANSFGTHKFFLGKRSANCTFCPGVMGEFYFAEIIVYNRVLSAAEKTQVTDYLNNKYFSGTDASFTSVPSAQQSNTTIYDDNVWKHSYNTAAPLEIIASVKDNCLSLGARTDVVYVDATAGSYNGQFYMRRHYAINVAADPAGTKRVRLYYTNADFADLQTNIPSLTSAGQLVVTKYDGSNEDGVYDPTGGTTTLIPSSQMTTGTAFGANYLEFDISSFSEFWIHTGNFVLPLNFISFYAEKCNSNSICLNWKTVNEQNVSHFEIERSTDGRNFSVVSTKAANNQLSNNYNTTDDIILLQRSRQVYYRIKQIDNDGKYSYSKISLVKLSENDALIIYPNPAKGTLTIYGWNNIKHLYLYDVSGRKIAEWLPQSTITIGKLSEGIYILKAELNTGKILTQKLVVQ